MYKRIRDLISNTSKKFHVFANEHHRETFVERKEAESANDRNDRSIRVAVNWYNKHLQQVIKGREAPPPTVVLITNDRDNRQKATEMGIEAYTIHDYAKSLTEHPALVDRLARSSKEGKSEATASKGKILFPEHLPLSTIQTGIKSGKYLQGAFQGS